MGMMVLVALLVLLERMAIQANSERLASQASQASQARMQKTARMRRMASPESAVMQVCAVHEAQMGIAERMDPKVLAVPLVGEVNGVLEGLLERMASMVHAGKKVRLVLEVRKVPRATTAKQVTQGKMASMG